MLGPAFSLLFPALAETRERNDVKSELLRLCAVVLVFIPEDVLNDKRGGLLSLWPDVLSFALSVGTVSETRCRALEFVCSGASCFRS